MTPSDWLLCERSPEDARRWAQGFADAPGWMRRQDDPTLVWDVYAAVKLGSTPAWVVLPGMDYDAWHEGLVHGVYGVIAYARWLDDQQPQPMG